MNTMRPPAYEDDPINVFLEQYDVYIRFLAWKRLPRDLVPAASFEDEVDELVQLVRIKLWNILKLHDIVYPKSYISRVVHTTLLDMIPDYELLQPLPTDEDGELRLGFPLITSGEDMYNPADIVEQQESFSGLLSHVCLGAQTLPPRQQYALICSLKDQLDTILPLVDAFIGNKIHVESICWPDDIDEKQRLWASLTVARKKMRSFFDDEMIAV